MMRNPFNKYIKFDIFNVYFILIISLSYHILHIELFRQRNLISLYFKVRTFS